MWIEITDQLFWKTQELLGGNVGPTTGEKSDLVLQGLRSADGKLRYVAFMIVNYVNLKNSTSIAVAVWEFVDLLISRKFRQRVHPDEEM